MLLLSKGLLLDITMEPGIHIVYIYKICQSFTCQTFFRNDSMYQEKHLRRFYVLSKFYLFPLDQISPVIFKLRPQFQVKN